MKKKEGGDVCCGSQLAFFLRPGFFCFVGGRGFVFGHPVGLEVLGVFCGREVIRKKKLLVEI